MKTLLRLLLWGFLVGVFLSGVADHKTLREHQRQRSVSLHTPISSVSSRFPASAWASVRREHCPRYWRALRRRLKQLAFRIPARSWMHPPTGAHFVEVHLWPIAQQTPRSHWRSE